MADITPKYPLIPAKDKVIIAETVELGERVGGMKSTASVFSKGQGNEVFKVTSLGIHLGAAEFGDAPFSVTMAGALNATSGTFSGDITGASGTFSGTLTIGGTVITIDSTKSIQTNIDTINTAGGGTLFLQGGTYTLSDDITMYSSITIEGVAGDAVILDFNSTSKSVNLIGTDVYTTGTISSIGGGVNVVGSSTIWISAMIGRQIFIDERWYVIVAVADNTHLTLASAYADGPTFAGTYRIANPIKNASIKSMTIKNSAVTGIVGTDIRDIDLEKVTLLDNNKGFIFTNFMNISPEKVFAVSSTSNGYELTNGSFCNLGSVISISNGSHGAVLNNIKSCVWLLSACDANTDDGINATDVTNCLFKVELAGNGGQGFEGVSGCNKNFINDSLINNNTGDGIKLTANCDNNTLGSALNLDGNGGWGINIANANCDENTVVVPFYGTNTSGDINDSGTGTNIVNAEGSADSQVFTSGGTWTKPANAQFVRVICIGAGGGGAGTNASGNNFSGGGGGGAKVERIFEADDLGATENITIDTGGTGGDGVNGTAGGNSSFGSLLIAYGGGYGTKSVGSGAGGGGGGITSKGSNASGSTGGVGGSPSGGAVGADSLMGGGGGSSSVSSKGGDSIEGGGGGGASDSGTAKPGGDSLYSGGGGGGGGIAGDTSGGTGGEGNGGAGSSNGNATDGVAPGGGGGGAGTTDATQRIGGDGSRGEIRVYTS